MLVPGNGEYRSCALLLLPVLGCGEYHSWVRGVRSSVQVEQAVRLSAQVEQAVRSSEQVVQVVRSSAQTEKGVRSGQAGEPRL